MSKKHLRHAEIYSQAKNGYLAIYNNSFTYESSDFDEMQKRLGSKGHTVTTEH